MTEKKKSPAEPGLVTRSIFCQRRSREDLLAELCDRMRQAGHFPARVVLLNDVALRCTHQLWLGTRHRLCGRVAVATLDRVLDGADGAAHLGAARLVDHGSAGNLARRFLGGSRIGHRLKIPLAETACWSFTDKRAGRFSRA